MRLAGLAGLPMQRTGEARALHASLSLHLPGKRSLYPSPHTPHSSLYPCGQRSVRQSQSQVIGSAGADRACGKYVSECVRECVRARVRACVRACVRA